MVKGCEKDRDHNKITKRITKDDKRRRIKRSQDKFNLSSQGSNKEQSKSE
jgi:hypothetical protein